MTIFSIYHFTYLLICTIICVIFYYALKNKSDKTKFIATFIPLALAFVIHFLKLFIPFYKDNLPSSIMSITLESVCAISTLSFPFIYFSKNNILKNYMVIIGTLSGLLTLIFPLEIANLNPFNIEIIRFFFAHLAIFISSLFMYIFNIYRPKGKWIKHSIYLLLLALFIVYINSIVFTFILEGYKEGMEFLKYLNIIH